MDFSQLFEFIVPFAQRLPVIRAILGFIFVFFLPGFAWTFVFFSRLHIIERIALSIGLSIAAVTLSIIVINILLGVSITGTNSVLIIIVIIIIAMVFYLLKRLLVKELSSGD